MVEFNSSRVDLVDRLGPELFRDGLTPNGPWVRDHANEAQSMFAHRNLRIAAVILASLDVFAIDYLRQAPVVALASLFQYPSGQTVADRPRRLENIGVRRDLARSWGKAMRGRPKLADLLATLGLTPQHRRIEAMVMGERDYEAIRALAVIPPSTLAQVIPDLFQADWLSALSIWCGVMSRRRGDPAYRIEWAARAFSGSVSGYWQAQNLADMAVTDHFSEAWSPARAIREADAWHDRLAKMDATEKFAAEHGLAFDEKVPMQHDLPERGEVDGYEFVALRSGLDLFEEGQAMRHCVASYAEDVIKHRSVIYGIRRVGERVATIEFVPRSRARAFLPPAPADIPLVAGRWVSSTANHVVRMVPIYEIAQLQCRYRIRPPADVSKAAAAFLNQINKGSK